MLSMYNLFLWFCKCVSPSTLHKYLIEWHHAVTNIYGERTSPWNMTVWIITFVKVFTSPIDSTLVFHGFCGEFDDCWIFCSFDYYPGLRNHIIGLLVVHPWHGYIFSSRFPLLKNELTNVKRKPPVPLVPKRHPFCSSEGKHLIAL